MLVIDRKANCDGVILYTHDGPIRVSLGDVRRGRAKLLLAAPRSVRIVREELEHHYTGQEVSQR